MKPKDTKVDPVLEKAAADVVATILRRMPYKLRSMAADVPIHFEAFSSDEVVAQGFERDILGLFLGESVGAEGSVDNPMPAQIILYLSSIYDFCEGDMGFFREEVKLTYLHELGHFFGWDEDQVAAHGLE